ncbi:MAG: hypothetical protein GY946_13220 [bacterium]|nr:hypothetical protein [bacterium]
MLLRAGGEMTGNAVDLSVVTGGDVSDSGVEYAAELVRFAEAIVGGDEAEIAPTREALRQVVGDAGTIDAAAVAGNFQRMVRIADGTGIPLDVPVKLVSADLREQLGIDAYGSASETAPTSGLGRLAGRLLRPLVPFVAKRMGPKPPGDGSAV